MTRFRWLRELLVILLAAWLMGSLWKWHRPAEELAGPPLQTLQPMAETDSLPAATKIQSTSFGEVHFGKRVVLAFNYTNNSVERQDLQYKASSSLLTARSKGLGSLLPGHSTLLVVEVNTNAKIGPIKESVQVFARGRSDAVAVIEVTGAVRRLIEIQPREGVVFGELTSGQPAWRDILLAELVPVAASQRDLKIVPDWLLVKERSIVTRADGTRVFDFMVGVPASAPLGAFQGKAVLQLDSKRFDPLVLPLSGSVQR